MPDKVGRFTVQERVFSKALALTGDKDYAANRAGYKSPASMAKASDPAILARVRELQIVELTGDKGVPQALRTLQELMLAPTPAAVRLAAAKVVLERVDLLGGSAVGEGKEDAELTPAEWETRIQALQLRRAALDAIDAEVVDQPPSVFD